jgi:hypothetical protein
MQTTENYSPPVATPPAQPGRREHVDEAIARVATSYGNITRARLHNAGLDDSGIHYRVRIGRLYRAHRGVFSVGHLPVSALSQADAAVLAGGRGAALSHSSAATLWSNGRAWPSPLEVTACARHRLPGVTVHHSRSLSERDVTTHWGIRVTTPARTALDLADRLDDTGLARIVNDLRLAHFLHLDDLEALVARSPGRRGVARLRTLAQSPHAPTRSEFEDAFLAFARDYGLPVPEVNQRIAGREVDILFPEHGLIVELDGYLYHSDSAAFERDRDGDADALAAELATVRITWKRLMGAPAREAARLRAILDLRAPTPSRPRRVRRTSRP